MDRARSLLERSTDFMERLPLAPPLPQIHALHRRQASLPILHAAPSLSASSLTGEVLLLRPVESASLVRSDEINPRGSIPSDGSTLACRRRCSISSGARARRHTKTSDACDLAGAVAQRRAPRAVRLLPCAPRAARRARVFLGARRPPPSDRRAEPARQEVALRLRRTARTDAVLTSAGHTDFVDKTVHHTMPSELMRSSRWSATGTTCRRWSRARSARAPAPVAAGSPEPAAARAESAPTARRAANRAAGRGHRRRGRTPRRRRARRGLGSANAEVDRSSLLARLDYVVPVAMPSVGRDVDCLELLHRDLLADRIAPAIEASAND